MARTTTKTPKVKMGRTITSDVQLQLGLVTITGNFCAVRKSESTSKPSVGGEKVTVESACPTCYDATGDFAKLKQAYFCEDDATHGPFERSEALKAVDGKVIGTAEEVTAAGKEDDEDAAKVMQIVPHYADEVEEHTIFTGAAYVFHPTTPNPLHPILIASLSGAGTMDVDGRNAVLLGEVTQRGKKHLYQLRTWNGHLVMQELARPEDMYEMEASAGEVDERFSVLFTDLVKAAVVEFDPATYEDASRQRLAEFIAARSDKPGFEVLLGGKSEPVKVAGEDAMLAMLSASVDAARQAKAS